MVKVTDAELVAYAHRISGHVVLITGAGSGIGRETALLFARYGAKLVLGDIDADWAKATEDEIKRRGGAATSQKCDVTIWADQLALFELAKQAFGTLDVVIPNAGIGESKFPSGQDAGGQPIPPDLGVIDVNVIGVVYTTNLALTHFENASKDGLKALIFMGSASSIQPSHLAPLYSASKHCILGLHQALVPTCAQLNVRLGIILPWFVETGMTSGLNEFLRGWPLVPITRVAAACLAVATNPDPETSGRPWLLPGDGEVDRLHFWELNEGLFRELNERSTARLKQIRALRISRA